MADTFQIEVVTPEKLVLDQQAEFAEIPGKDGYLGVLAGHAALLGELGEGTLKITAGGQTLGKMAVGIKVVPDRSASSIDLGRAVVREAIWLLLAAPAGLGFLTIFGRGHRGLHDRFAGTRVVR